MLADHLLPETERRPKVKKQRVAPQYLSLFPSKQPKSDEPLYRVFGDLVINRDLFTEREGVGCLWNYCKVIAGFQADPINRSVTIYYHPTCTIPTMDLGAAVKYCEKNAAFAGLRKWVTNLESSVDYMMQISPKVISQVPSATGPLAWSQMVREGKGAFKVAPNYVKLILFEILMSPTGQIRDLISRSVSHSHSYYNEGGYSFDELIEIIRSSGGVPRLGSRHNLDAFSRLTKNIQMLAYLLQTRQYSVTSKTFMLPCVRRDGSLGCNQIQLESTIFKYNDQYFFKIEVRKVEDSQSQLAFGDFCATRPITDIVSEGQQESLIDQRILSSSRIDDFQLSMPQKKLKLPEESADTIQEPVSNSYSSE